MSQPVLTDFRWVPGNGPDANALSRMAEVFTKPRTPMGEAWFMAEERHMYPELLGSLDLLSDEQIVHPLEEIASGMSAFGPLEEWIEWYHYLLPRLLKRRWGPYIYHPVELLVTGLVAQHPNTHGRRPYAQFQNDVLETLGQYIMSPEFWQIADDEVPGCFDKWEGPNGNCGWDIAEGLLSASLFLCLKYLPSMLVGPWFHSVASISNIYWQAQLTVWLVGVHPILTNEIEQPAQLSEELHWSVGWNWSHVLAGDYTGKSEPSIKQIPFLPARNREAVMDIARQMAVGKFAAVLANPRLDRVSFENAGLEERFMQLYRKTN